jgi:hypothetical protein
LFIFHDGKDQQLDAVIDTIVIEPDQGRFILTWRTSLPLRRNCFEIEQVVVGKTLQAHHRETTMATKTYYKSLADFIRDKKRSGR